MANKKPQKKIQKKSSQKSVKKLDKRIWLVAAAVAAIAIVIGIGYHLMQESKIANTEISLEQLCEGGATIYDKDGNQYATLDIKKAADWLENEEIPESVRAIDEAIGKSYGQLIVEQFYPASKEQTILAKALEKKYSHTELEDFFLNTVYLGDGVYGLSSGAKHFYGGAFTQLSEKTTKGFAKTIASYIENGQYVDSSTNIYEDSMIYEENGYLDGIVKETAEKLIASGRSELESYNMIFFGDVSIYSYLDAEVQKTLDEAYADKQTFTPVEKEYSYIQSAMVIMDHEGHILAVASGNDGDKIFNRALSRNYQVGSTIKPVSTYALGIEGGHIHFSTPVENRQEMVRNERGEEYLWPSNSDGEYGGKVLVTRALQESKNTVAVAIGRMVGEEKMYDFLKNTLGFDLLYYSGGNSDVQLSALTLGYFYEGITLEQITSSYEIFAKQGTYFSSTMVQKVVSSNQEILLEDKTQGVQALSAETAYITNRLLYNNVNGEYGIAKSAQIEGVEVLGKTGTTGNSEGKSDSRMFIGVTGDYIAGVWIGFDIERSLSLQSYYNPDTIFSNIMARLPHSQSAFEMPDGVVEKAYCKQTGQLAGENCQHTELGYYTMDNIPEYCTTCENNK